MAFTPSEQDRILTAIRARLPQMAHCAMCSNNNWTLASGYVVLLLQEDLGELQIASGPSLPCVALVCSHCGNTQLLNLLTLGLGDLLENKAKVGKAILH